jgi:hypothetical protein
MPWAIASAVIAVAGAAITGYGEYEQGQAAKKSANYNSEIAANNATIAQQTATRAANAGEEQAAVSEQKTRATVGAIKANQAAGNIDVNSGSAVDVRSSAEELGELDALTVRSNAAKTAYGYQTQAASYTAQSQLDKFQGNNAAIAGDIGAAGSILGGVSGAAGAYGNYLQKNSPIDGNLDPGTGNGTVGPGTGGLY